MNAAENPLFGAPALQAELQQRQRQLVQSLETLSQLEVAQPGCSDYQVIQQLDKTRLRYYPSTVQEQSLQPALFIVYALVNRPEILDLHAGRSLIAELSSRGVPVYLIDWGDPDSADCLLGLDDYINGYIDQHLQCALAHSGEAKLDILGVCQGGTFSLCYAALHPQWINSLITMVAPVDFHCPDNPLSDLLQQLDTELIRQQLSNVPGAALYSAFQSLTPMQQGPLKQVQLSERLSEQQAAREFLYTERWVSDSPDLAASAFAEFVDKFFKENRLVNGGLEIGGHVVDLQAIRVPVMNLYATRDHLVPPASSRKLRSLTGSRLYQERRINTGHIGIFVGRKGLQRVPGLIRDWLQAHQSSA